jgi:ABC-type uncharacterized transport system permease subunit
MIWHIIKWILLRYLRIGYLLRINGAVKPFGCALCLNTWITFILAFIVAVCVFGALPALVIAGLSGLLAAACTWIFEIEIDK